MIMNKLKEVCLDELINDKIIEHRNNVLLLEEKEIFLTYYKILDNE